MNFNPRLLVSAIALAFAVPVLATDESKKDAAPEPAYTLTGHVDLVSAYYLRGITNTYGPNKWLTSAVAGYPNIGNAKNANSFGDAPESRNPALQWGADFTHASGWYAGYWGSTLTYSYKKVGMSYDLYKNGGAGAVPGAGFYDSEHSTENDLYGGYSGKVGELGYNVGMTYYVYLQGKYSDAPETKVALTYGDFTAQSQTLLQDTIWGNKSDTYWTLTWTKALPYDLTFTANAGYYTYGKQGKFLGSRDPFTGGACAANNFFFVNGCFGAVNSNNTVNTNAKLVDGAFRHLILGISQPIGSTGATWNAQAIIGGYNRFNIKQEDKVTVGINYAF